MSTLPLAVAVVIVMAGTAVHHAVTGHHRHLALLRLFRPQTVVPHTAHDAWFHTLSWPRKIAVNAALITAAVMTGAAWMLAPLVTVVAVLTCAVAAMAARGIRSAHRRSRP